jgi:membrane protein YdbS with pleckstrin-like domain
MVSPDTPAGTGPEVVVSLRPVFIGWITLLMQLPMQLFFTLWCGGFFGGIGSATGLFPRDSWRPFVLFGLLAFVGVPLVAYVGKRLNYARTEYKFFPDRLEFEEGFFTINKKVIKLRDVKEVTLHKNPLQRLYGLGTIYLATLATGSAQPSNAFNAFGFGNVSASGIGVRDIRSPDEAYEHIRRLVDAQDR